MAKNDEMARMAGKRIACAISRWNWPLSKLSLSKASKVRFKITAATAQSSEKIACFLKKWERVIMLALRRSFSQASKAKNPSTAGIRNQRKYKTFIYIRTCFDKSSFRH